MTSKTNRLAAIVLVVAETVSLGAAVEPAFAQNAKHDRETIKRQQRLILMQQRQIEEDQRRLAAQNQGPARQPQQVLVGPVQTFPPGLLGQAPLCPIGYHWSPLFGCMNN